MKRYNVLAVGLMLLGMYAGRTSAQWQTYLMDTSAGGMSAVAVGNQLLVTGGSATSGFYQLNENTGSWTRGVFSRNRNSSMVVSVQGDALFYGLSATGWMLDRYTPSTGVWSTVVPPVGMVSTLQNFGSVIGSDGKLFFAGGNTGYSVTKNIQIWDAASGVWSSALLSEAKTKISGVSLPGLALFAGGVKSYTRITSGVIKENPSQKLDVFQTATGVKTTMLLSKARLQMSTAVCGNKAVFAGGAVYVTSMTNGTYLKPLSNVDIYDATTGTLTTATLSQARFQMAAAVSGNKILFAGGVGSFGGSESNRVDIYDVVTGTWTTAVLSEARYAISATVLGNNIYFAGGLKTGGVISDRIDIYNVSTGQWTVATLSAPRYGICGISGTSSVAFAGGFTSGGSISGFRFTSNRIDYLFPPAGSFKMESTAETTNGDKTPEALPEATPVLHLKIYPMPFFEQLTIEVADYEQSQEVLDGMVYDLSGRLLKKIRLENGKGVFDASDLPLGLLLLQVEANGKMIYSSRVLHQSN